MAEKPGREVPPKIEKTAFEKAIINQDNTIRRCPVCDNGDLSTIHQIGRVAELTRVYCGRCGVAYFAQFLPSTPFYGSQYNRFFRNSVNMIGGIKLAAIISSFCRGYNGKIKGLEIGPGSGYALQALNHWGLDFEGVEMEKEWAAELQYKMDLQVHSGGFLNFDPPYRYNLVFGSHIIEHFEDAHAFWIKLNSLVKIFGLAVLAAPDIDQSNNFDPNWFHFRTRHPWEHCCVYGYRALEFAARTHGFQLIKFDRQYEGTSWFAMLRKNFSITKKGVELDGTETSPPFPLPSV